MQVDMFFFHVADNLPKTNIAAIAIPLKNEAWETILSFWGPAYFQGRTVMRATCDMNLQNPAKNSGPIFHTAGRTIVKDWTMMLDVS